MAVGYSNILRMPKPAQGDPTWATYYQRMVDIMDGGVVTVTKVSGATTLPNVDGTADKAKKPIIRTTAVVTAAVQVNVPAVDRVFLAENLSTGTGTWKIQTASNNNGVIVPKLKRMWLRSSATGVQPASRTDGRSTATEIGLGVLNSTHYGAGTIKAVALNSAAVTPGKIAGAGSYGRLLYSATTAGFAWTTLARGTANQTLSMSTAAVTKPTWKTPAFRAFANSTGIAFPTAGNTISYSHGLTGIANKYDYKSVKVMAECISADAGYSVGDCIEIGGNDYGDAGGGAAIIMDSVTAVKLLIGNLGWAIMNKSSGAGAAATLTRWVARFKVAV